MAEEPEITTIQTSATEMTRSPADFGRFTKQEVLMNPFTYSYPVKVYFGEKAAEKNLAAKAIADSTVLTGGCAKKFTREELLEVLLECR